MDSNWYKIQIMQILQQLKCIQQNNCGCPEVDPPVPPFNQNNKVIVVELGSDYTGTPLEQLVSVINDTNSFVVDQDEIFVFNLTPDEENQTYQFIFKLGKGTWGAGNNLITQNDFIEVLQNQINTGNTDSPLADNGVLIQTNNAKTIAAYQEHLEFVDSLVAPDTSTLKIADSFIAGLITQDNITSNNIVINNPGFTAGRIPFTTGVNILSDSSKLLWDNISSYLEMNGNNFGLRFKETLNNSYVDIVNSGLGSSSLVFKSNYGSGKTLLTLLNPTGNDAAQLAVGNVISVPNESQLYIYGGNSGANIDMRGKPSRDECNMDFEGNDWDSFPNSLGFSYFGNQYIIPGTVLGYPKNRLGQIRFYNADHATITTNHPTLDIPFRFGINDIEIANLADKGWYYQDDYSADNASNPRWLTDKEYVDNLTSGYIPLAGTLPLAPVTGDIQAGAAIDLYIGDKIIPHFSALTIDDGFAGLITVDGVKQSVIKAVEDNVVISHNDSSSEGLIGEQDFTANITDLAYTQKKYVDNEIEIVQDQIDALQSTRVISGIGVSINAGDNTKFDIQVIGEIIDPNTFAKTPINVNLTAQTVIHLATQVESYVTINSSGTVIQSLTPPDPTTFDSILGTWVLVHSNLTNLNLINYFPMYADGLSVQFHQLLDFQGFEKKKGTNIVSAGTTGTRVTHTGGLVKKNGIGDLTKRNITSLSGAIDATFRMRNRDGAESLDTQTFDVDNIDVAGITTLLANNKFGVAKVWKASTNVLRIQRGQYSYDNFNDAFAGISRDTYVDEGNASRNLLHIGWIIFKKGTSWGAGGTGVDGVDYKFIDSLSVASSGGGGLTPTLQATYDISTPSAEIQTNAIQGALTLRQGSGADTDMVLEVKNGAGAVTASIDGEGDIIANSLTLTTDLAVTQGGTGASTASAARTNLDAMQNRTNYVLVKSDADLPTTLADNTTYEINGTITTATARTLGVSNAIIGRDKSDDRIVYTGAGVMFTGSNRDLSITNVTLSATNGAGSIFNLTGTTNNTEVYNCIIAASTSMGTIDGGNVLAFHDNFLTLNSAGLTVQGTYDKVIIADNIYDNNSSTITCITIPSGTFGSMIISRNQFDVSGTQTGLNINAGITISNGNLSNNIFTGAGTKITGFTHTTTNWLFTGNLGIANRRRELFISKNDMTGLALTTPTTAAAATAFLSDTGVSFLTLRGGAGQDDGLAFQMQVPSDYFSGGTFDINFTTDTTASNIKLFMGLTKAIVGANLGTLGESGLSVVTAGVTQYNRKEVTISPITTTFAAGDIVVVKIWRDPDDAADVATGNVYIANVQFVYNSI